MVGIEQRKPQSNNTYIHCMYIYYFTFIFMDQSHVSLSYWSRLGLLIAMAQLCFRPETPYLGPLALFLVDPMGLVRFNVLVGTFQPAHCHNT